MKDSGIEWIGSIPETWICEPIGNHFECRNTKVSDRDYPPLSVAKIGVVPQMEGVAKTEANDARKLVKAGDFVINSRSDRKQSCGVADRDGSVSLINIVLCNRSQSLTPEYMGYSMKNYGFAEEFYRWGNGIVADLWSTRWDNMKKIFIPIPPKQEQQKIVTILDQKCKEVDELIALQEKMIEELKAYKQSVITETITKGLNPDAPMKDSGIEWIGQIPEHWKLLRLKNVGSLYGGLTGKAGDDFNVEDGDKFALFIPFTNIWNNTKINPDQLFKVKVEEGEKQNCVRRGDVLFLMSSEDMSGIGKSSLCDFDEETLYLNSFCKGMHINNAIMDSNYMNYFMICDAGNTFCRLHSNGFIRINLRQDKLNQCPILCPPLNEQKSIASWLDKQCEHIESLISIKQSKIAELQDYKKSLIYEYVTGKKEVQ